MQEVVEDPESGKGPQASRPGEIQGAVLELPYVPDFLLTDARWWFAPSKEGAREVYHQLVGASREAWQDPYLTKKGERFLALEDRGAEGPFRIRGDGLDLRILEPGRIFAPKPRIVLEGGEEALPIVSLPKHRPLNPWKPNYVQALNFIRKYEWPVPLPRSVHHAVWEIEECGQIAGSVSWKNAELILRRRISEDLRKTIVDIFFNRPEDFPLGSEVYLRVLGRAGPEGFGDLLQLAEHPISRKRRVVAQTLGDLRKPEGISALLMLLEDEDPDVRKSALRAIGKVGIVPDADPSGKVRAYLDSAEIPLRVWASQALLRGGDEEQEEYLLALVKEEPRLLTDMGELGDVLSDLELIDAVPYLIQRLKHEKSEYRADAAEALSKLTKLDHEYQSLDNEEQRRTALKTYTRWWEDCKRERRKSR